MEQLFISIIINYNKLFILKKCNHILCCCRFRKAATLFIDFMATRVTICRYRPQMTGQHSDLEALTTCDGWRPM